MARKYRGAASGGTPAEGRGAPSGFRILVVDDSEDILDSTRRLLEAEGHRVLTAVAGPEALDLLEKERVHLILVDYFMPGMTGEEVVRRVRAQDRIVQIILQTGYSGEKPARVMMRELDIQGYHDKSQGAEPLLLWVDSALKASRHVLAMEKHRVGLRYVLDLTPELHRLQPLDELLEALLWQVEGLLGAENSFLATLRPPPPPDPDHPPDPGEGFVALVDEVELHAGLRVRFGTGRFQAGTAAQTLLQEESGAVQAAIRSGAVQVREGASVVPLVLGERPVGLIYLDRHSALDRDRELLEVYARQAAAAIHNSMLYSLATTDALTGVDVRGFAAQRLHQAIKHSIRRRDPLSLLMLDLDGFKQVNDRYGHQVGDRALRRVGELLRDATRETDVVGRYGGDEFMIVLPDTPAVGALVVAERLLERAQRLHVEHEGEEIPIRLSLGVATLLPSGEDGHAVDAGSVEEIADGLVASADRALYAAKGTGRAGAGIPLTRDRLLAAVG